MRARGRESLDDGDYGRQASRAGAVHGEDASRSDVRKLAAADVARRGREQHPRQDRRTHSGVDQGTCERDVVRLECDLRLEPRRRGGLPTAPAAPRDGGRKQRDALTGHPVGFDR